MVLLGYGLLVSSVVLKPLDYTRAESGLLKSMKVSNIFIREGRTGIST